LIERAQALGCSESTALGTQIATMTLTRDDPETSMEADLLPEPEDDHPKRAAIIIFAVFFEAGLAPIALFLGWILGRPPLAQFVWSAESAWLGFALAGPLIVIFVAMLRWPIGPFAWVKRFCDEEVLPLLEGSTWSEIALVAISAGVGEEMLFRAVGQGSLSSWLGPVWGLVLASLLFGLLHPISVPYMVMATFLGFYLGLIWIYTQDLLTVMVTHALNDFVALGYVLRIRAMNGHDADEHF
jgi:uncharacterized protein